MVVSFRPMDEETARQILGWRYEGVYAVYNPDPAALHQDLLTLLEPVNAYYSAWDAERQLLAYRCFGADARVRGGDYSAPALDTGGGLRPNLTGRGLGLAVLQAGLEFGRMAFAPPAFRVTVAAWNERALKVCRRASFEQVQSFLTSEGVSYHVLLLPERRPNICSRPGTA